MCFLLVRFDFFAGEIIDYSKPDVMDMKCLNVGFKPTKPFTKFLNQQQLKLHSQFTTLEKTKMVETRSHY
jgi:hypothetical protein